MNQLAPLLDLVWSGALIPAAIVFLRVGAAMALLPALGETVVPLRVRLALTVALTLAVTPAVLPEIIPRGAIPVQSAIPALLRHLGTEIPAGLSLGLSLRLFVLALQTAGAMAAQATSLSQMFGGQGAEPMPAMSHLMVAAGLALAMVMGLPERMVAMLIQSYDLWPAGTGPDVASLREWGVGVISQAFALAFCMAAPFLITGLLYNVALGILNRAMPQLMITMIGAPAMVLGAMLLMAAALPVALGLWVRLLLGAASDPFGALP